jgi:tocopherol O-methyltransferase
VTGITISSKQVEIARRLTPATPDTSVDVPTDAANDVTQTPYQAYHGGKVRYLHLDAEAIASTFPAASFSHIWVSECLSHLPHKAEFFAAAARLLQPGGRLVIADWFASPGSPSSTTPADAAATLRAIEDGMLLPPLCTIAQYTQMATAAGLEVKAGPEDLSKDVARTWDISWELVSSPSLWAFAISQGRDGLAFLQAFRAMRRGYASGVFAYGVVVFEKGEEKS